MRTCRVIYLTFCPASPLCCFLDQPYTSSSAEPRHGAPSHLSTLKAELDKDMMYKDLTETLAALATLATLPELTPSHLGWLVVLVLLTRKRDGQPPRTPQGGGG